VRSTLSQYFTILESAAFDMPSSKHAAKAK